MNEIKLFQDRSIRSEWNEVLLIIVLLYLLFIKKNIQVEQKIEFKLKN